MSDAFEVKNKDDYTYTVKKTKTKKMSSNYIDNNSDI